MDRAMGLTSRLADDAGLIVKEIGSLELVSWEDTDAFLRVVKNANVAILGIEGFFVAENSVRPISDAVADFSELSTGENVVLASIEEASRFLLMVSKPNMYFDFAFDDDARIA
jgi:hypothetical protein